MALTIRSRLTLWYSLVLFATLAATAIALVIVHSRLGLARIDRGLADTLITVSNGLDDSIYGPATSEGWDFHSVEDSLTFTVDSLVEDTVWWEMKLWPLAEGRSAELSESHLDAKSNDDPDNWCHAADLYDTGGTEGVGLSTTRTVVAVSIAILIADFILTKLFMFFQSS